MDLIGLVLVFLGIIAFGVGAYELIKKTVVGRNTSASTEEQKREFSKYDGCCYIGEGIIALLLAFSNQLFGDNKVVLILLALLFIGLMVFNFIMAKKIMGGRPSDSQK